jgi:hypothetical protein
MHGVLSQHCAFVADVNTVCGFDGKKSGSAERV